MTNARIIRLGPSTQIAKVVNFNDAFIDTEVSNIFGKKNKAKRQEKKKARIEARKEKRLARIQARNEVRSARQQGRQQRRAGRQAAKTEKALMRQDRRSLKSQARQQRRTDRKGMRLDRRAMGDEVIDDDFNLEMEDQGYQPDSGYESQNADYGYENNGNEEYENEGESDYQEEFPEDENPEDYGTEVDFDDQEYYPEYEDDSDLYNFDGISKEDDPSNEFADAGDVTEVPAGVQNIADKLEWNREYVVRLNAKKNDILVQAPDANIDKIEDYKIQKEQRISALKRIFKGFINFEGNIDERGQYVESAETIDIGADGNLMQRKRIRARMVKKAIDNARIRRPRRRATQVDRDLNPNIDEQRIEVPAEDTMSYATGTGLIGLDDQNDFDAPDKLDIQLGADGKKSVNTVALVIAGVGVGLLGIYLVNKYVLKKK